MALIGDYRSMIITLENLQVSMHPSINPVSIALHMDWKHGNKDKHLFNNNNEIARDVCGRHIFNNGDWNNRTIKDQFLSTMTKLHKTCEQGGEHSSSCES